MILTKLTHDAHRHHSKGFTLVEMLLVLVILAALAAVVVPKFAGRSQQAKETAARSQIANLEIALDMFETDNGYYPAGSDGMNELIDEPNNATSWQGPYLKKGIPIDPWGNDYTTENMEGCNWWNAIMDDDLIDQVFNNNGYEMSGYDMQQTLHNYLFLYNWEGNEEFYGNPQLSDVYSGFKIILNS